MARCVRALISRRNRCVYFSFYSYHERFLVHPFANRFSHVSTSGGLFILALEKMESAINRQK